MNMRPRGLFLKAYDALAEQPITAHGLNQADRNRIVVSAIVGDLGETLILSRLGDAQWDLRPFFDQANVSKNFKFINWDTSMPDALVDDCKAVVYAWFKRGLPGSKPPVARGITSLAVASVMPFIRWLKSLGILNFSHVHPIHISNYTHYCKHGLKLKPLTLYGRLRIIEFLWVFASEMLYPLKHAPWGESTLSRICGISKVGGMRSGDRGVGKTDIIPTAEQAKIFNHCERVIQEAKGKLYLKGVSYEPCDERLFVRLRDAVLYILSITSGMRNDEAIGVEVHRWRREYKAGVLFCWVSTVEHKTGKGRVEYLVPELTLNALDLLVTYSASMRKELEREIRDLEGSMRYPAPLENLLRLDKAIKDSTKIFIARHTQIGEPGHKRIGALSLEGSNRAFDRTAKAAGSTWPLRTHQCRRTYARCFVESRMGRTSLIWLKWQFKHSSMSMTQLYASNPQQDLALFDEIMQQMAEYKIDLIESWLDGQPLAGGAGEKITEMRAVVVKDRNALLAQTAPHSTIRATGHGWCLATERGCGGAGLYEATRCPGCKNSVIDKSFANTWRDIYSQQKELTSIVDAGPAVIQRAQKDLEIAFEVINKLGVSPTG